MNLGIALLLHRVKLKGTKITYTTKNARDGVYVPL